MFVFAWHCHSCDRGFHLIQHVRFPVAEYFALLLPEGVRCTLSHPGQEVVNRESRGSSRWAQADGDTAVFRDGGAAEVTAGGRSFDPTGLPLDPLPMQRCLSLCEGSYSISTTASMLCVFFLNVSVYLSIAEADYDRHCESLPNDTVLRSTLMPYVTFYVIINEHTNMATA